MTRQLQVLEAARIKVIGPGQGLQRSRRAQGTLGLSLIRCFFGAYYREPRSWRGRTRDRVRRQRDRGTRPAAGGGAAAYFADPRGAAHGRRDLRHLRGAARSAPRPGPGRRAARQDINSGRRRCRTALPADRETPTWQSPSRAESGSPAIGSNWSGCVSSRRLRARRRSHLLHAPPP